VHGNPALNHKYEVYQFLGVDELEGGVRDGLKIPEEVAV